MSSTISSKGPGTGSRPRATSQRRGPGMRVSVAAYRTVRMSCLRNDSTARKRKESFGSRVGLESAALRNTRGG
jgi:hypothetical protein